VLVEVRIPSILVQYKRRLRPPQPQPGRTVYTEPIILPLNADGELYALQDEQGRIVGTGTREICDALLTMLKNEAFLFRRAKSDQSDRNCKRP
jgi:hypothetical protein